MALTRRNNHCLDIQKNGLHIRCNYTKIAGCDSRELQILIAQEEKRIVLNDLLNPRIKLKEIMNPQERCCQFDLLANPEIVGHKPMKKNFSSVKALLLPRFVYSFRAGFANILPFLAGDGSLLETLYGIGQANIYQHDYARIKKQNGSDTLKRENMQRMNILRELLSDKFQPQKDNDLYDQVEEDLYFKPRKRALKYVAKIFKNLRGEGINLEPNFSDDDFDDWLHYKKKELI